MLLYVYKCQYMYIIAIKNMNFAKYQKEERKGGLMRSKILIIIAILAIMPASLSAGKKQASQKCIDKVSENCEYICGVGADFYFPDQEDREFNNIEDPDQLEIRVAQKEDRKY